MRTVRRLRLRCLLFRTICVLLPSLLAHHVETGRAHQKETSINPITRNAAINTAS
jgi:hypothetical protein